MDELVEKRKLLCKELGNIDIEINKLLLKRNHNVEMSQVVVDTNPYSRLMALKRMGVVNEYEKIRTFSILIVGIGGVGSVASEMLTRCGIGKLILYDYDTVEIANMNRLFFRPEQAGMTKTEAAAQTLRAINPDVEFESYNMDITTTENFEQLMERMEHGGMNGNAVDVVLSCVDNYAARTSINQACNELDVMWIESGVSEDAVSGHIQTLLPGRTACFECLPPLIVASGIEESTLKREGVCAASLPTTMGMVAGMLVQNVLKTLLHFGQVSYYLGYSAMTDFFPNNVMRPNVECQNSWCRKRQEQYDGQWEPMVYTPEAQQHGPVEHEENDWGIETCQADLTNAPPTQLGEGLSFAYERSEKTNTEENGPSVTKTTESLQDLMGQLKGL